MTDGAVNDFDLSAFEAADEAEMVVRHPVTGEPTSWRITFAGPGHPRTQQQSERNSRRRLHEEQEKERARVNGRKWKGEEQSPAEVREENVRFIVERILRWTPVKLNGEMLDYSPETATRVLSDTKMGALFQQCLDFLIADASFLQRSAPTSGPMRSASSPSP